MSDKYEYRIRNYQPTYGEQEPHHGLTVMLNSMGERGWRLVDRDNMEFTFIREIPNKNENTVEN